MKDMGSYVSWAQLVAASGMVAITYTNREPATDVHAALQYMRDHAAALDIDENRIGLWSCSGNVPTALSVLMRKNASGYVRCAVLSYGYMLDAEGATGVADAAGQFGFVNPCAGQSVEDLPHDIPLFLARAGHDQMPRLNETLDRCIAKGLACNLPVTFVNHANGPHAFDLFHDTETSREVVRGMLAFLRFNLLP
jgi:acetyl esterase/lipase